MACLRIQTEVNRVKRQTSVWKDRETKKGSHSAGLGGRLSENGKRT